MDYAAEGFRLVGVMRLDLTCNPEAFCTPSEICHVVHAVGGGMAYYWAI